MLVAFNHSKPFIMADIGVVTFAFGQTSCIIFDTFASPIQTLPLVHANAITETRFENVSAPFFIFLDNSHRVFAFNVSSDIIRVHDIMVWKKLQLTFNYIIFRQQYKSYKHRDVQNMPLNTF